MFIYIQYFFHLFHFIYSFNWSYSNLATDLFRLLDWILNSEFVAESHQVLRPTAGITMQDSERLWEWINFTVMKFNRLRMLKNIGNSKMWWNSSVENRLLWKHNKTQKCGEIPMWKTYYCGNTIKSANMMKFQCGK